MRLQVWETGDDDCRYCEYTRNGGWRLLRTHSDSGWTSCSKFRASCFQAGESLGGEERSTGWHKWAECQLAAQQGGVLRGIARPLRNLKLACCIPQCQLSSPILGGCTRRVRAERDRASRLSTPCALSLFSANRRHMYSEIDMNVLHET
jgi:hypothetical protein